MWGGGGCCVTGIKLSVRPSVGRMVPRLLMLAFLPRVTIYHAYGLPIAFGSKGQRSSTLGIKVAILCLGSRELSILPRFTRFIYGFRVPEHYPFYLESLYHTYILMRQRCCLSNFRSKVKCTGHQSSNMISRLFSIILST